MLMLRTIRAKDVGPLADVEITVKPGVTYVYGLNRAAGPASKNRNGTGKTVTFGIPRGLLYDDAVGGTSGIEFLTNNGKKIEIVSKPRPRGAGLKTTVSVDGVEKKLAKIADMKALIRKAFPLTQEDYDTYVHIDSRVPHPLVMGTTAQRQAFFTKFFGLDRIDAERKLYVAELNKLKSVRSAFDELRAQYQTQKTNLLDEEQVTKLESRIARLSSKVARLQEQVSQHQNTVRLVEFGSNMSEHLTTLKDCIHPEQDQSFEAAFEEHYEYEKENLVDADAKLKDARAWDNYREKSAEFEAASANLSSAALKLLEKGLTVKQLRVRAEKLEDQVSTSKASLMDAVRETNRHRARLEEDEVAEVEQPAEEEGDLLTLKKTYEHQIEHAEKFSKGVCESCGQTVDVKDPEVLRKRLKNVSSKLSAWRAHKAYVEDQEERASARRSGKELKSVVEDFEAKIAVGAKRLKAYREVLALPTAPEPFTGLKLETNVCEQMVEEVKEKLSMLKFMRPHLETVVEFWALTKTEVESATGAQDLEAEMYSAQERLNQTRTKLQVHETFKDQAQAMRRRLVKMKKLLEDEEPLQHLVKGYQNKNLKKMAIEAISEHLMDRVNKYAQEVMPERFVFSFVWDTQIRMLVHRPNGKTSDVRSLSGAESTFFTLVLVCALLAFVPDSKRVNVLILDEPAARLSDELKETFKKLVAQLNQLIPSIYVITPHQETYDGAHYITVVKAKDGSSSIVEAHPLTIK